MIVLGGGAIALLMYLLANSGANQRYANAYNQNGGYQGGNQGYNNNYHYTNRRMFAGERDIQYKKWWHSNEPVVCVF